MSLARYFGQSFLQIQCFSLRSAKGNLPRVVIGSGLAFTSHDLDHGLLLLVSIPRSYDFAEREER